MRTQKLISPSGTRSKRSSINDRWKLRNECPSHSIQFHHHPTITRQVTLQSTHFDDLRISVYCQHSFHQVQLPDLHLSKHSLRQQCLLVSSSNNTWLMDKITFTREECSEVQMVLWLESCRWAGRCILLLLLQPQPLRGIAIAVWPAKNLSSRWKMKMSCLNKRRTKSLC